MRPLGPSCSRPVGSFVLQARGRGEYVSFAADCAETCLLPAVRYSAPRRAFKPLNRSVELAGAALALLLAWALAAAALLDQPSVGVSVAATVVLVAHTAGATAAVEPAKQLSKAWAVLADARRGGPAAIAPTHMPPPVCAGHGGAGGGGIFCFIFFCFF